MATLTTNWQNIASWSYTFQGYGNYVTFYLDAKYSTQSIENNNTAIQTRLTSVLSSGSAYGAGYNYTCSYAPTVSGSGQWNFENETITSGGDTIRHNDDGTKSLTLSATVANTAWGFNHTLSADVALPTIPRATSAPNLDGYIESSVAISLNPASSSFKHRIYYSYNGKTGYYPSSTGFFTNTGTLNLDSSFYNYTPKATGTGTITLYTYNSSGTLIGSKTGTLTVRCDSRKCVPDISATIVDSNQATIALTGNNQKLIKGYSNAQITYTITPKNGATITNKKLNNGTLGNSPYTVNGVSTSNFDIYAVDSREFNTTVYYNKSQDFISYIPLYIEMSVYRPTPTGSAIEMSFTGDYFNNTFGNVNNSLQLSWKYKETSSNTWIDGGTFVENTDYKIVNNKVYSGDSGYETGIELSDSLFPYNKSYDIALFFEDKIISASTTKNVSKGLPIANWDDEKFNINGKFKINNMSFDIKDRALYNVDVNDFRESGLYYFGPDCENIPAPWSKVIVNGGYDISQLGIHVDSNQPEAYIRGYDGTNWSGWKLINSVYEAGSNSNGNYRKYADGTMICWNQISVKDQAINNAYGSLYQGTRTITFPATFLTDPVVACTQFQWGTSASWGTVYSTGTSSATLRGIDVLSRATGTNCVIGWYAIGRWKWI